jgi:hypothetical protein
MWHLLTFALCSQLLVGGATSPGLTAAPQFTTPDVAPLQEGAQPPAETGEKPQGAPQKPEGEEKGGPRIEGGRISMGPPEEEIELPTGPMRIELFMVSEERVRYEGEVPEQATESSIRLHVKLTGERLAEMVGLGHLVIEEMIDDTGAVLASRENLEPRDEKATSPVKSSKRLLARGFVNRSAQAKAPSRAARKLAKASGWVNIVYATKTEEILIDNPLQYEGGWLEHPRLKELGLKIRVITPGDEVNVRREGRGIALQFEESRKKIEQIEFFDAWLKPMYARSRTVQTPDGEEYTYYGTVMGAMDADTQMLLTVYPEIEEDRIRFEFKDVELP